uniref:Putative ribonuclease H-like domain-containing protein n=1 Tax=Tanacetum cinerariifolium TaxID=118510 RepID=A0A6L2KH54_TANCI|nr:putative ribonuclease H-like domain-containing protein [Tanacetum cinerariifolium]
MGILLRSDVEEFLEVTSWDFVVYGYDYSLWEVIENGATLPKTHIVEGVMQAMPITSVEDRAQRRLEVKARSTLMMGIPNEHQLKFNSIKDAKLLLEDVKKRFGGNGATKKTQRKILKQQYENFTASCSEMLDQTFDMLQKLVSYFEILGEKLSQEDVNQKLLRSLSSEWNTHAVVWRNNSELETMSMDDLYYNFKVYELEVEGMSSSISNTQNITFVSSTNNNTSSTNETVNTTYGVSIASTQANAANIDNLSDVVICSFFAIQSNSPQLAHKDFQQIHPDDIEEMDFTRQMAMLTMRTRRFLKNTGRKLTVNTNQNIGFDKSKVECYNCHKTRHFTRECIAPRNQDYKNTESSKRSMPVETPTSTTLVSCDGLGGYDWSDQAEEGINYALIAYSSLSSDSEVSNNSICSKSCLETVKLLRTQNDQLLTDSKKSKLMVLVPPPLTGIFMPSKPDLSFIGLEEFVNEPVVENRKLDEKVSDVVNAVKGRNVNAVKASTCWVWKPKTKVIDHISKHNRFEDPDFSDRVCKVKKVLYGLHQAPRAWYETLSTYLLDSGFQRVKIDKTLFIKRHKGDILLVQVYVDDIIFASTKKELCTTFENLMHEKFQMSSMGELTFFLGLQVNQNNDGIFISQDKYVAEILKKFEFTNVKTTSTTMETQKPMLKDEDCEEVDVYMYISMIGSLMYMTSSMPDIMFVVSACARYQVNRKVSHLHDVKRIFRFYAANCTGINLWNRVHEIFSSKTKFSFSQNMEMASRFSHDVVTTIPVTRHLEELHVTWAHLEKKRTRLRTYTNISQEFLLRDWRRRHRYNVTPSQ